MVELLHRIKVFVYSIEERAPSYLLLRSAQGADGFWGPIHGSLGLGEKLEGAIRREVLDEIGLARGHALLDLQLQHHWALGDEQVIEWNFGFHAPSASAELRLDPRWAESRWVDFAAAYPCLELDTDRAAIVRLHTLLGTGPG